MEGAHYALLMAMPPHCGRFRTPGRIAGSSWTHPRNTGTTWIRATAIDGGSDEGSRSLDGSPHDDAALPAAADRRACRGCRLPQTIIGAAAGGTAVPTADRRGGSVHDQPASFVH